MKKYTFNGLMIKGGQERFFLEIMDELDKITPAGIFEILVPEWESFEHEYLNISIVRYKKSNKLLWLQIDYPWYLLKNKRIGISLFNYCSIIKPDIGAIHDLVTEHFDYKTKSLKTRISHFYWGLCRYALVKKGKKIITVSDYSKNDIMKVYGVDKKNILVLGNAWQHMNKICSNLGVIKKYPFLKEKQYFFSLGSSSPRKNLKWIYEVAKRNPNVIIAIAGEKPSSEKYDNPTNNVYQLGKISDEDMKGLMENCKAFLFPSYYEGFGIPPLEALSVGAKIIISNASCLSEIFGSSAYYINPDNYDINLEELLLNNVDPPEKVLNKYSWANIAKQLYSSLCSEKI